MHLDVFGNVPKDQWPELLDELSRLQPGEKAPLGIRQKQTGADRLCLGGALAANIHGRGLRMKPFVADVEAFELVNALGELVRCSRTENRDLFQLAIGGYGLFGVVVRVCLRLDERTVDAPARFFCASMPLPRGCVAASAFFFGRAYGDRVCRSMTG